MPDFGSSMSIYDEKGNHKYLTSIERERFIIASELESPENRVLCRLLHDTGCRLTEALELTASRINIEDCSIVFRTLKQGDKDKDGVKKKPKYREVPVSKDFIDQLDLKFNVRVNQKKTREMNKDLWYISRTTAWRTVKRVMKRAGITGIQATTKGLRHGLAIKLLTSETPAPPNIVKDIMGHSHISTTEIYMQAVGAEKRKIVLRALGKDY
jgi:integrase/recombinase XerD